MATFLPEIDTVIHSDLRYFVHEAEEEARHLLQNEEIGTRTHAQIIRRLALKYLFEKLTIRKGRSMTPTECEHALSRFDDSARTFDLLEILYRKSTRESPVGLPAGG